MRHLERTDQAMLYERRANETRQRIAVLTALFTATELSRTATDAYRRQSC